MHVLRSAFMTQQASATHSLVPALPVSSPQRGQLPPGCTAPPRRCAAYGSSRVSDCHVSGRSLLTTAALTSSCDPSSVDGCSEWSHRGNTSHTGCSRTVPSPASPRLVQAGSCQQLPPPSGRLYQSTGSGNAKFSLTACSGILLVTLTLYLVDVPASILGVRCLLVLLVLGRPPATCSLSTHHCDDLLYILDWKDVF